jgi:hypothetical protein
MVSSHHVCDERPELPIYAVQFEFNANTFFAFKFAIAAICPFAKWEHHG